MAERLPVEIVSCDSQQVYVGMDVGTGKPTAEERRAVPHHLLDAVLPSEQFHAARWAALARPAIEHIAARGRVPVVVGAPASTFGRCWSACLKRRRPTPRSGGDTEMKPNDWGLKPPTRG